MKQWLDYFEWNKVNRHPVPWKERARIAPHLRKPLIRSMRRFQVGESGEGSHLRKQAATTGCELYQKCIDLFIKEEQEHARLMAEILKREQAPLLTDHWTDNCFILLRRLFSLEHELLVLLVPEIIAKRYFRALRDGTDDPVVRAVCHQIMHDEEGHVAFHVDYLRRTFRSVSLVKRIIVMIGWKVLFQAACVVVMLDHGSLLRAVGVSRATFWWDCLMLLDEAAAAVFSSVCEQHNLRQSPYQLST
jgi:hypothetical protein